MAIGYCRVCCCFFITFILYNLADNLNGPELQMNDPVINQEVMDQQLSQSRSRHGDSDMAGLEGGIDAGVFSLQT